MKKALILILGLFLVISFVYAEQAGEIPTPTLTSEKEMKQVRTGEENNTDNESKGPVINVNGTEVQAGLYNALQNVENENARAALQRNMERFLERYQERLQKYENVTIEIDEETQEMVVKGKKEVKYLGFIKGTATEKIEIAKNGDVKEKKPWFRFMYSEKNTEE